MSSLAEHVDASRIGLEISGRAVEPGLNGGKAGAAFATVTELLTSKGVTLGCGGLGTGGALRLGTPFA